MRPVLRVLVVEDSADDAALAIRELRRGGYEADFERVETRDGMSAALEARSWDLVLCDHSMPGFDSLAALALLRERALDIPFFIVSGVIGEDHAIAAMKAGAHDYLVKGKLARLCPAVERELRECADRRERTRVEAALRESERLKAAILDAAFDCVVSIDARGFILDYNPAAERTLGFRSDEVIGQPVPDWLVPPTLRLADREGLARHTAAGGSQVLGPPAEITALRRDGTRFQAEVVITRVELSDGPVFTAFLRDVTEQRRVTQALVERTRVAALTADVALILTRGTTLREALQGCAAAVVEHLGVVFARIWTLDARQGVLELQASAGLYTRIDGGHARVPVGKFKIGLIATERRPHLSNEIQNDPRLSDPEWARREGMVAFAGHPLLVDDELVGVMGMFSRQPLSEMVLLSLGAIADAIAVGVKRKLVEAAQASLEQQLRQAQKMEAVGRLAGGIAHDFNNLLCVITGFSELMLVSLDPVDPLRCHTEEIHRAGERAAALTRQLLAFSRRQILQPQVLDLNTVVEDMDRMLRRVIGEDVDLESRLQPGLGRVRADPGQLEQVIMNLAVNSRDAMPGGGKLTIETADVELDAATYGRRHPVERAGPHVMLAVSDTGCGMDAETQARIFEPFFTTKERGKGTGLGLSTVYGIIKQSGGDVWVYSEPGRGTAFKIYLPRVAEDRQAIRPPERTGDAPRGTETILLVEDDDPVRAITQEVLRRQGYTVLPARDGGEALLLAEKHPERIHLVLTDIVMPVMSGNELAERLAQLRPGIGILFFSGYSDEAVERHAILQPGVPFLHKPFSINALARKVRAELDARRGGA